MKINKILAVGALSLLLVNSGWARTWTSADGTKTFEATYRSFNKATGQVNVVMNGSLKTFDQSLLSEADRKFIAAEMAKAETSSGSSDKSEALKEQVVGAQLLKGKPEQINGKKFKRVSEFAKAPEFYILYFSASW